MRDFEQLFRKPEIKCPVKIITNSMKPMHDTSNGLGGIAGYGIYPEYKEFYALHMFFDCQADTRKECESFFLKEKQVLKSFNLELCRLVSFQPLPMSPYMSNITSITQIPFLCLQLDEKNLLHKRL